MSLRTGFTLIELLVVIAIIRTLASVVLASLNAARESARFANVVSTFNSIHKAAELYNYTQGAYASDVGPGAAPAFVGNTLPTWPEPPCDSWTYDWENWSGGNNIQISLRNSSNSIVYRKCVYQNGYGCTDISTVTDRSLACN